jgi:hypothetical protein
MTTTKTIFMPENTGRTGLVLELRLPAGTLVNTGGSALTETPASSGRFTATVTQPITETLNATVKTAAGVAIREGWLADSSDLITPDYPVTGSSNSVSVDVLPLNSRLEDPVEDTTITVYVDETRVVSISLWDKSLQPVDLQGLSLVFTVRDKRRNLVQTLTPTVSGQQNNTITVTLPPSVTDVVGRSLDWSLRVVGTQLVKAKGVIEVRWAP